MIVIRCFDEMKIRVFMHVFMALNIFGLIFLILSNGSGSLLDCIGSSSLEEVAFGASFKTDSVVENFVAGDFCKSGS